MFTESVILPRDGRSYTSEGPWGHFNSSFVPLHDITMVVTLELDTNFPYQWNLKPFPPICKNQITSNPSSIALGPPRHLCIGSH